MGYIALKEIKVKTDDGRYVVRKPGDAVPEADGWKNIDYWVKAKHVGLAEEHEGSAVEEPSPKRPPTRRKVKATRKVAKKGARRARA